MLETNQMGTKVNWWWQMTEMTHGWQEKNGGETFPYWHALLLLHGMTPRRWEYIFPTNVIYHILRDFHCLRKQVISVTVTVSFFITLRYYQDIQSLWVQWCSRWTGKLIDDLAESFGLFKQKLLLYLEDEYIKDDATCARKFCRSIGNEGIKRLNVSALWDEDKKNPAELFQFFES